MKRNKYKRLIWIDLEMTGLDPKKHRILEINTIITNEKLKILSIGPEIIIFQNKKILKNMNNWSKKTHKRNGLLKKVKKSLINEKKAEKITISFLKKWVKKKVSPICGNSISQDRLFLRCYMPKLEKFFHYRQIDVSSIKELVKRWRPELNFIKKKEHTAKKDIINSINEMIFYKKNFLKV